MRVVNIQQAKTHLSRLVEEAGEGEEIVITKSGKPRVRLVPCTPQNTPRTLGGWENKVRIAADFDETSAEVVALFEGRTSRTRSAKPRR